MNHDWPAVAIILSVYAGFGFYFFKRTKQMNKENAEAKTGSEYFQRLSNFRLELREGKIPSILTVANLVEAENKYVSELSWRLGTLEDKFKDVENFLNRQAQKVSE
jgi:lipopolysaccharide biosynthesis regulator YciM